MHCVTFIFSLQRGPTSVKQGRAHFRVDFQRDGLHSGDWIALEVVLEVASDRSSLLLEGEARKERGEN